MLKFLSTLLGRNEEVDKLRFENARLQKELQATRSILLSEVDDAFSGIGGGYNRIFLKQPTLTETQVMVFCGLLEESCSDTIYMCLPNTDENKRFVFEITGNQAAIEDNHIVVYAADILLYISRLLTALGG